jgi:hypothetical protein
MGVYDTSFCAQEDFHLNMRAQYLTDRTLTREERFSRTVVLPEGEIIIN